jgi:hypothetical protein
MKESRREKGGARHTQEFSNKQEWKWGRRDLPPERENATHGW